MARRLGHLCPRRHPRAVDCILQAVTSGFFAIVRGMFPICRSPDSTFSGCAAIGRGTRAVLRRTRLNQARRLGRVGVARSRVA